jgi:processive 1,2-diacylglycerol beta-glucosyltransferase
MKIIIPYVSAGAGHLKAAEAIQHYLREVYPEVSVQLVDALEESTGFFRFSYLAGYTVLIRYATFLWAIVFWLTSIRFLRPLTRGIASLINYLNTEKLARLFIRENPDYIISTHFLPSEIAAGLKKAKKISSKVITIITDYGVHPYWLSKGTDIYVAASSFTRDVLIKEGIDSSSIREFGIPVDEKFRRVYDRSELCQKLGLDESKFILLIMTGSFGIGPIEEIVDLLYKDTQLLVVCARNQPLFENLKIKNYPGVKVFAFVDNVQELMAVSSAIVTKPGGLSSSELLAMDLAPIFIAAIPGQETTNMYALESLGVGVSARSAEDIRNIVLDYINHPEKLSTVRERIKQIRKPHAAGELCDAVCQSRL